MAEAALGRLRVDGGLARADTVVVGAGIAGCAAARFLVEAGESVLVVDRGGIGAGASGRNGGFGGLSSIGMIIAPGIARRLAARDHGSFAAERPA